MSQRSVPHDATASFTATLQALASGAGRLCTELLNTNLRPGAKVTVGVQLNTGAAPTVGTTVELYLIRNNGSNQRDDNAGAVDALFTPRNAPLLGTLVVPTGVIAGDVITASFDTWSIGDLGPAWSLVVFNRTNLALGNEANMIKTFQYYTDNYT